LGKRWGGRIIETPIPDGRAFENDIDFERTEKVSEKDEGEKSPHVKEGIWKERFLPISRVGRQSVVN